MPRLREVSDDWLAEKGAGEKSFSLGYFDEHYLQRFDCAVVERRDASSRSRISGAPARRAELSVDLMRSSAQRRRA